MSVHDLLPNQPTATDPAMTILIEHQFKGAGLLTRGY